MALELNTRKVYPFFEEIIRIFSMKFILFPCAYILPVEFATLIARFLSLFLLLLPYPGVSTYYDMRSAFGMNRFESVKAAWDYLSLPFRDYVMFLMVMNGREDPSKWTIIERNPEGIEQLRRSEKSFILVSGHFSQIVLLRPRLPYDHHHRFQVAIDIPRRINSLLDLRVRIKHGTLLEACSCCDKDSEIGIIGNDLSAATQMYMKLREPGNVVSIALDAAWDKNHIGSYERPFAGARRRWFSMGAVQLARFTGCPVIGCVLWLKTDRSLVVEWGEPFRIAQNDLAGEVKVMNNLLNMLEVAVGKRPAQYYLTIGNERRWNSHKEQWEDLDE